MTHVYAYIREGCYGGQLRNVIEGIKNAVNEGFNICSSASTVAVKELAEGEYSDNFGAFVLVYTAKGKGFDVKKKFARLLNDNLVAALPEVREVKMVIKEQANDMSGVNGVLRYDAKEVNTAYEAG